MRLDEIHGHTAQLRNLSIMCPININIINNNSINPKHNIPKAAISDPTVPQLARELRKKKSRASRSRGSQNVERKM